MKTTLNAIRAHIDGPDGWEKLLHHLGKTQADDEVLHIRTVLQSNGLLDALRAIRREAQEHAQTLRLYAIWCARQTGINDLHLAVAEKFARVKNPDKTKLEAYYNTAWEYAFACVSIYDPVLASVACLDPDPWAAAWRAVYEAPKIISYPVYDITWHKTDASKAFDYHNAMCIKGGAAFDAQKAAYAKAFAAQELEFLRVLDCIDAGENPYPPTSFVGRLFA